MVLGKASNMGVCCYIPFYFFAAPPRFSSANSQLKQNSKSSLGPKAQKQEIPQEAHVQAQKLLPFVYGAVEKRLNDIEFKRSGKDLRALKQILEAMQKSTKRLDQKKEGHASNTEPQISYQGPELCNFDQRFTSRRYHRENTPIFGEDSSKKDLEMTSATKKVAEISRKPRNSGPFAVSLEGKSSLHRLRTRGSTENYKDSVEKIAKDRTLRKNHPREPSYQPKHVLDKSVKALRSTKTTKTLNHVSGASPSSPRMSPIIVIPRLQQKIVESQTHPPVRLSDTSTYGMLTARKHMVSNEITVRLREDSSKAEPITYLEVSLKPSSTAKIEDVRAAVERMFDNRSLSYADGPVPLPLDDAFLSENVQRICICDTDEWMQNREILLFWQVKPVVLVFQLSEEGPCEELSENGQLASFNEWMLPAKEFDGLWESLIYESGLKQRLIRYAASALLFSEKGVNPCLISWNRDGMIKLYGKDYSQAGLESSEAVSSKFLKFAENQEEPRSTHM